MKKLLVACAAVLSLVFGSLAPAQANHALNGSHWGQYQWGGGVKYGYRAFFIFDHSNNATVTAALTEFVTAFNNDSNRRGLYGQVPIMLLWSRPEYAGQCGDVSGLGGYSFTTVCAGRPASVCGLSPPVGASITCTGGGHSGEPFHPYTWIQRDYPDYNTTFSHVGHELLHQIGIGHSSDPGSLVYPTISLGVKKYLNEHDWSAVAALYQSHPASAD